MLPVALPVFALILVLPDSDGGSVAATISGYVGGLLWFVLLIYDFKALRRYCRKSFKRTCAKYFVQMAIYFLLLIPTSTIAILLLTLVTV